MAMVLQHHPRGAHFGEFLRDARERRGLTLRDVSNETKIPWRHLEAFEHGDLTVVRNRMYRRAEVRAYAQAVGLDQNVALAELENALLVSGTEDPEPEALQTPDSIERRHQITATLSTVAAGGIVLIMWQLWTKPPAERATLQPAPATASPEVAPTYVGPNFSSANTAAAKTASPTAAAPAAPSTTLSPPVPAPTLPVAAPAATSTADAAISLIVTSDPAGARVTVDGIGRGTTPVSIRFLRSGERTIRVIKDGYASEERSVRITDGRPTSVHVPLRTAAN
jgi:cytoskeleton protein RodZ